MEGLHRDSSLRRNEKKFSVIYKKIFSKITLILKVLTFLGKKHIMITAKKKESD